MTVLSFTIPDEHINEVVEAFAMKYGYPATVPDPNPGGGSLIPDEIPNPQSKAQFAKGVIRNFIRATYITHMADVEAIAAREAAEAAATTIADTFADS